MTSKPISRTSLNRLYASTLNTLKQNRIIFSPFVIFTLIATVALIVLFMIPRMPLRTLLGPPVKTFWGERFLHYPLNFVLLPKLASYSKMVLTVLFGSFLTGVATVFVVKAYQKKSIKWGESLKLAFKKYLYLAIVLFLVTIIFYFFIKAATVLLAKYFAGHKQLLFLKPQFWFGPVLLTLNFVSAVFINACFIYTFPAIMADNKKFFPALWASFQLFKKHFFKTLFLIGLPMLLYVPIIVLDYNTLFLIKNVMPESILYVQLLSILVTSLMIDPLISVSTTLFYLMQKETSV